MFKYLVTGATGLIGSALVRYLSNKGEILICPVRNIEKARRLFADNVLNNITLIETDLCDYLKNTVERFDYIIHCASPTASKYFVEKPVETLRFGIDSTVSILEYSRFHKVKSIVYLSSLESYGTLTDDNLMVSENYQGYVNPLETRSSYNIAKRTCECLCHSYSTEYDIPVKILRLTQTISSIIETTDNRVFAQFARAAATGKNIELHTTGESARQYIYIDDAVDAILTVLKKGRSGEAYNAANADTYISAKDMAEFVQANFNPNGRVFINLRDDMGYAPTTKIKLDVRKLNSLGWAAKTSLYEMFDKLIRNLKNNIQ